MLHIATEETYQDGQIIFEEGSSGDWVYLIQSGKVEISEKFGGKKIIVDDEHRLWLKKGSDYYGNPEGTITYMLISAEGEYLTDQTFPCEIEVVRNGMAYGYVIHDDGVRVLKRFRLVGLIAGKIY